MADQSKPNEPEGEDEDYMGDLSMFLPSPPPLPLKSSNLKTQSHKPSTKKPKAPNWQNQRRIDRERKQREEDEKLLVNLESAIPQSNIGFKMLKQMGYNPGDALGGGWGRVEPVGLEIRRSRAGIGREDPVKEKLRCEEVRAEKKRKNVEDLIVEFGSRQKSQWRSRRVVVNFRKARGVLDQLENKEVVEPEKKDDKDGAEQVEVEEEEEIITEEDLLDILMKLRDEHCYCLFCGCKYESVEELLSNCPGIDEDDH
ncbi:hypothetical protein GIB67_040305 [Kingdonia uniflora]|uniref:G-patch domain-containing protein n=1 Tax=Kingdonia uniflora TaxID=39325 RepID=A0A7J7MV36_9MAGN|nr:hypothetical protein GIB67_040305 [Kingdonia uniflora]